MLVEQLLRNLIISLLLWGVGLAGGLFLFNLGGQQVFSSNNTVGSLLNASSLRRPECYECELPTFKELLSNNLKVLLISTSGFFCGGLTSLLTLLFNGSVTGMIIIKARQGMSWWQVGILLVPHGFFELAGLLLGSAVGLQGWKVFNHFLNPVSGPPWRPIKPIVLFISLAIILTILASWIEVHVTFPLINATNGL
jgi:uncharacterized membrane protein SpoIIM required for sporulation